MTEKNTAQSLLEKLTAGAKNTVTIDIQGVEFTFNKDAAAYDSMINVPGLALKIAGTVNKVLVPEIEVTVKN